MLESKSGTTRPDTPAKAVSSPERVASSITKGVLRRHYVVGQRLIESDLTHQLGVSRSTVREALKILAANGVVELVPHRGAVIRGLSLTDAIGLAVCNELQRDREAERKAEFLKCVREVQAAFAAMPVVDPRTPDEILGYDEFGLPT